MRVLVARSRGLLICALLISSPLRGQLVSLFPH